MNALVKKLFGANKKPSSEGLYDLVQNTSSRERNRFIRTVVKESNKDQRDLVEQYNRKVSRV